MNGRVWKGIGLAVIVASIVSVVPVALAVERSPLEQVRAGKVGETVVNTVVNTGGMNGGWWNSSWRQPFKDFASDAGRRVESMQMNDSAPCAARIERAPGTVYVDIQAAVDAAVNGDIVQAAGTCSDVQSRVGMTQTVYIDKDITLRGGYQAATWAGPDPVAYPTVLDPLQLGRGVVITGTAHALLEGLTISNGKSTTGGGLYVSAASVAISGTQVVNNLAGRGGGIAVEGGAVVILAGSTISGNQALWDGEGVGAGVTADDSTVYLIDCTVSGNGSYRDGGGIRLRNSVLNVEGGEVRKNASTIGSGGGFDIGQSTAHISGCVVVTNTTEDDGAGFYVHDGSDVHIERVQLSGNYAGAFSVVGRGGGLFAGNSFVTVEHSQFSGNLAGFYGGGLAADNSTVGLRDVTISGSFCGSSGCAVWANAPATSVSIHESVIRDNSSRFPTGGIQVTGGAYLDLENSLLTGNEGRYWASALDIRGASARLANSTFSGNRLQNSDVAWSAIHIDNPAGPTVDMVNCIVWGNTSGYEGNALQLIATGSYTVSHSDVGDGVPPGEGNLSVDPLFVDAGAGDFGLSVGSPCIDTGTGDGAPTGDLSGNPRPLDGDGDGTAQWDMGAYEAPDRPNVGLPVVQSPQGSVVEIPITITNVSGLQAVDLAVTFDPAILGARTVRTGALTGGWSLAANTGTPGRVAVALAGATPVDGGGTLAVLEFDVLGPPGAATPLHLDNVLLNEGQIVPRLTDGTFTSTPTFNVGGRVGFWYGGEPVPNTQLVLSSVVSATATSDATGSFTLSGIWPGGYVLAPSKSNEATGITAFDASLALRHSVGLVTLAGPAAIAGDVNRSGRINAMDASYILQKAVDLIPLPFPGSSLIWDFIPISRTVDVLAGDVTGQDFTAILLGDISGNWASGVSGWGPTAEGPAATLQILASPVAADGSVTATLWLDPAGNDVYALDLVLTFDGTGATVESCEPGAAAGGWLNAFNEPAPGELRIALAGALPIAQPGEVLTLRFRLAAGSEGFDLAPQTASGNDGEVALHAASAWVGRYMLYLPNALRRY